MTHDPNLAAREFIRTHSHLTRALGGLSVDAQAGYLAACSMAAGPDILSAMTIRASVALFAEVLAEQQAGQPNAAGHTGSRDHMGDCLGCAHCEEAP